MNLRKPLLLELLSDYPLLLFVVQNAVSLQEVLLLISFLQHFDSLVNVLALLLHLLALACLHLADLAAQVGQSIQCLPFVLNVLLLQSLQVLAAVLGVPLPL